MRHLLMFSREPRLKLAFTTTVLFLTLVWLNLSSCGLGGTQASSRTHWNQMKTQPILLGQSVQGRSIEAMVLGDGSDICLVMATIHGDENAGTPLTYKLAAYLEAHPELLRNRKVVLMPVVNPDGYAANTRYNARGVDLNRNFPARNREEKPQYGKHALSEPEARIVERMLARYKFDRIVSMHEPLKVVDYDGPAEPIARHMGKYTTLPVKRLGGRPGSLGSYAGLTLNVPIITLEFPKGAGKQNPDELWRHYGKSLVAFITYPNPPPADL